MPPNVAVVKALRAYGFAAALVVAATALRWLISPGSTQIVPFATYFPAVLGAALYGGFRPGLLAAAASMLLGEYFFVRPIGGFDTSAPALINGALFLGNAVIIAALAAHTRKLLSERKEKHQALETLHAEQGHRISNKLTLIASLLSMQIKGAEDQNVREALAQALARVESITRVHEHLQRGIARDTVDAEVYLGELCRNLAALTDVSRVAIECRIASIDLDIQRALPFGMVMTELVTNALKHAYPPPASGQIRVAFDTRGDEFALTVSDDGKGLPENFERTGRLGVKVVRALVAQLRGSLTIERGSGTTFVVRAPV